MDGLVWLFVILVPGAAAVTLWITRREQGLSAQLRQARTELNELSAMLDVWLWHSDSEHRLVFVRPPRGNAPPEGPARPEIFRACIRSSPLFRISENAEHGRRISREICAPL